MCTSCKVSSTWLGCGRQQEPTAPSGLRVARRLVLNLFMLAVQPTSRAGRTRVVWLFRTIALLIDVWVH